MYLCATGSIPIAAALILKGLSPGAALVLLMAGPATNMAAILVINKILGRKTLITYLLTIIIGSMGFGLIIDYLLPTEWFTSAIHIHQTGCCGAEGAPWWQTASSILFVILLATAFILQYRGKKDCCHDEHCSCNTNKEQKYRIDGMMCNHCKANVEKNLAKVEGVESVRVELTEGAAYIQGKNVDPEKIIETIQSLGYKYIQE